MTQTEMERIFRGLASLLHAGIAPAEGVFLLAQEERSEVSALLTKLGEMLDLGRTLRDAMEESGAFPAFAWAMAAIGEETGRLEEALIFLAEYCRERQRNAELLRQAVLWPCSLFAMMLIVIGVLLVQVLPVFDRIYASLGTGLDGIAGGLLRFGQELKYIFPVLMVAAAAVLLGSRMPKVRTWFRNRYADRGLSRKFNNARFARALAMGIGSGLHPEEAVALAEQLLSDIPPAADRCARAREALERGEDLAETLQREDLLPPARCRMLAVGLRSGNVDRILEDVADRMEEEAGKSLTRTLGCVEPALVLLCAGLVGLILLSVMVPLLDILSALG